MKRSLVVVVVLAISMLALGQTKTNQSANMSNNSVNEMLIALEKQAWEAWKNKDGNFFQRILSEDTVGVGAGGVDNKTQIVKDISGPGCEVRNYSLDNFRVVMPQKNTAILTYKAMQDATCNGKAVPATVWASSVFVKRSGKWLAAFHQETPAQ